MLEELLIVVKDAHWLYGKFGNGNYEDIPGFCKIADRELIESKGWSLTPSAYVGSIPIEEDGGDFEERMTEIHQELVWPEYIGYYMRTPQFRNKFQAFSTMTTRASLRNEDLLSLEVELPKLFLPAKLL